MKLCEAIAILKGTKSRAYAQVTEQDKLCQKPALFNGFIKTYEPLNEDDQDRPDGDKALVQQRAPDVLEEMTKALVELFDIAATQEWGNCQAVADIEIEGAVLAEAVPVTYLLFLEKQLQDLLTAVNRVPTLSPEYTWQYDAGQSCYVSDETRKVRTKKKPTVVMTTTSTTTAKDGAITRQESGQVIQEDLPVGYWRTVYFSAALPLQRRKELAERVVRLQAAVKQARERANGTIVERKKIGQRLLSWVFED